MGQKTGFLLPICPKITIAKQKNVGENGKGEEKERRRRVKRNGCTRCFYIEFFVFERKNKLLDGRGLLIQKYSSNNVGNRRWQRLPQNLETGHKTLFEGVGSCHQTPRTTRMIYSRRKKAVISRIRLWFRGEMTSEKRAQKFHTDDVSLHTSGYCFWLVEENFSRCMTNQKHFPNLSCNTSSVWNFCSRCSDIISRGNQWWCRQMPAFCSGFEDGRLKTFLVGGPLLPCVSRLRLTAV